MIVREPESRVKVTNEGLPPVPRPSTGRYCAAVSSLRGLIGRPLTHTS